MTKEIKSQEGYVFRVQEAFLRRCPRPEEYFAYDLINDFQLPKYLPTFHDRLEDIFNDE